MATFCEQKFLETKKCVVPAHRMVSASTGGNPSALRFNKLMPKLSGGKAVGWSALLAALASAVSASAASELAAHLAFSVMLLTLRSFLKGQAICPKYVLGTNVSISPTSPIRGVVLAS